MSDVRCPYCNHDQEINHDDGYGYDEDREHEQSCVKCSQEFKFTTAISWDYQVMCQAEDHKLSNTPEHCPEIWDCENCDYYEYRRKVSE